MSAGEPIPFNLPYLAGNEQKALSSAVSDRVLHGDGRYGKQCQQCYEARMGAPAALMTPSCSLALDLAMLLARIKPGDEVLVPDFTFVTTAQCVALRGATPVFCDIRSDTMNLDEARLHEALTPATRAIIPIHYGGVCAEMDAINRFACDHDLLVVEDAAQAIGASYHDRPAGSLGDMAAFSFHATKNIQCGEGGMLIVNNRELQDAAHIAWEKGTNRRRFAQGRVDKYQWTSLGTSFVCSELNAAMLAGQLSMSDAVQTQRRMLWRTYETAFHPHAEKLGIGLARIPDHCVHNGHLFYLIFPDPASRNAFQAHLHGQGIQAHFHYVPLHTTKGGRHYGRMGMELHNAAILPDRLVRLPMFFDLTVDQQQRIIDVSLEFLERL